MQQVFADIFCRSRCPAMAPIVMWLPIGRSDASLKLSHFLLCEYIFSDLKIWIIAHTLKHHDWYNMLPNYTATPLVPPLLKLALFPSVCSSPHTCPPEYNPCTWIISASYYDTCWYHKWVCSVGVVWAWGCTLLCFIMQPIIACCSRVQITLTICKAFWNSGVIT